MAMGPANNPCIGNDAVVVDEVEVEVDVGVGVEGAIIILIQYVSLFLTYNKQIGV